MFSKRVTRVLVFSAILVCRFCPTFASGQSAPRMARGTQISQFRSSVLAKAQDRSARRGPVTPADAALKHLAQKANKAHAFGSGVPPSTSPTFLAAMNFNSAGQDTWSVATGDLNGDGIADLVLADQCGTNNCGSGSVSVLLGIGDGTFSNAISYQAGGTNALAVAMGDVNGDGKVDVIVASNCLNNNDCSTGSVSVLMSNGDGTLQSPVTYGSGGQSSQYVALADVNGDAKADIVVTNNCASNNNCSNGSVGVMLNNGDGTFQSAVAYDTTGQSSRFVATADLNNDGKADLVVANYCADNNCSNGSMSVLLGNGDGSFQTAVSYVSGGQGTQALAIGDVNGDGKSDVVLADNCLSNSNCQVGQISLLLGNGDGTFQASTMFNSGGTYTRSVALADINGDDKLDVLAASQTDQGGQWQDGGVVSVLLGNGDATFQPAFAYTSGQYAGISLAVTDLNRDGKLDVVMANECVNNYSCLTGGVSVYLGNGDGTLVGAPNYNPGGWAALSVAVADVDADGKLDLLVTEACNNNNSCSTGIVSVLLGNGDGTFKPAVQYDSAGQDSFAIVAGDVNGDGKLDLLIANECAQSNCSNASISVLLGNGDGTFQAATAYSTNGLDTLSLATGDVNGDGKIDIVTTNECDSNCTNGSLSVLLGNGDGSFQTAVPYNSGGQYAFSIAIADLNGDGKSDLVAANQCATSGDCSTGNVVVLLGNGDGTFQPAVSYGSGGGYAFAVAVGDLNGDGKADVVVTNQCSDTNNCPSGVVGLLLGNGDGTFQAATTTLTPVMGGVQTVLLGDFNGDHNLDVVSGVGNLLLLGNGDGTFRSPLSLGASGIGVASGDLNGDGRPDLAVGGVSVLLNISGGFVLPTTTTVTSSLNPSVFGASVTFTASVAAQASGTPTGTITFTDGSDTLGQANLSAGTASLSISSLSAGSHSITASYSGDSKFIGSVSSALSLVVQNADTTTSLTAAPAAANINQSVSLTATVASGSPSLITGTMTFMDGSTQIGNASVNSNGVAVFSTIALTAGTHSLTAVYSGDSNFNGSTSGAQTVIVSASGFSLSSSALSPASVVAGASAHSTITITPVGGFNPSSVNLTCSVSPVVTPAVGCSIADISVSAGAGSATLTLTTSGSSTVASGSAGRGMLALALLIPGLFICGAGMGGTNRRRMLAVAIVFLAFTGCMLQTACSGFSAATPAPHIPGPRTPAGNYTVTVTGSASGMQQTTSVVLTVR